MATAATAVKSLNILGFLPSLVSEAPRFERS
jgi:hypothetical protein